VPTLAQDFGNYLLCKMSYSQCSSQMTSTCLVTGVLPYCLSSPLSKLVQIGIGYQQSAALINSFALQNDTAKLWWVMAKCHWHVFGNSSSLLWLHLFQQVCYLVNLFCIYFVWIIIYHTCVLEMQRYCSCILCRMSINEMCFWQTAQMRFIRDKTIYTQQLDALRKRIGDKHISRAQPYYELLIQSRKVCAFHSIFLHAGSYMLTSGWH